MTATLFLCNTWTHGCKLCALCLLFLLLPSLQHAKKSILCLTFSGVERANGPVATAMFPSVRDAPVGLAAGPAGRTQSLSLGILGTHRNPSMSGPRAQSLPCCHFRTFDPGQASTSLSGIHVSTSQSVTVHPPRFCNIGKGWIEINSTWN